MSVQVITCMLLLVAPAFAYDMKCSVPDADGITGSVMHVTDGQGVERCFSVVTPTKAIKPMPVLFWFHGSGGNGGNCGKRSSAGTGKSWAELAVENGFTFICGEAVDGLWGLPSPVNDTTGNRCDPTDPGAPEVTYLTSMFETLAAAGSYDLSRIFFSGCSMGSAMSFYSAACVAKMQNYSQALTAFATHSTGLKLKGDGNHFPPINGQHISWGECDTCKYFPAIVEENPQLKACIFDNTGDPSEQDPFFYRSSEQLAKYWQASHNPVNTSFGSGGHCQIHSFEAILDCLDDDTGRLLPKGPIPFSPSPSPAPSPPGPPGPPSPSPVPADCLAAAAKVCPDKTPIAECKACLQQHQADPEMRGPCWKDRVPFKELENVYCK